MRKDSFLRYFSFLLIGYICTQSLEFSKTWAAQDLSKLSICMGRALNAVQRGENQLRHLKKGQRGWTVLNEEPITSEAADEILSLLSRGNPDEFIIYSTRNGYRHNGSHLSEQTIQSEVVSLLESYGKAKGDELSTELKAEGIKLRLSNIEVRWSSGGSNFRRVPINAPHTDGNSRSMTWSNNGGTVIFQGGKILERAPSLKPTWITGEHSIQGSPTLHSSPEINEKPRLFVQWFFVEEPI